MPKKRKSNLLGTRAAQRKRLRRKNESEEQRRQRLARESHSKSIRRANESEEKRRQRLAQNRDYVRSRRAKQVKKERLQKLAMEREAALSRGVNESEEEYRQRLAELRQNASSRRAKKSEEECQRLAELIDYDWSDSSTESEKKFNQRRYVSFRRAKKSKVQHSQRNNFQGACTLNQRKISYPSQSKRNLWKFTGTKNQVNQSRFAIRSKISSLPSVEFSRDWTAPRTVYGQKASATKTNLFNNSCKVMNYSLSSVIDCPPPEGEIAIVESYSSSVKDEFETDNVETYIGPPNPLHEQNVNVPACREIKQEPAFEELPILTPSVECFRIAEQMQEDNRYLLPDVVEEYCDDEISIEPCDKDGNESSSASSVTSEDETYAPISRSRMVKRKYFPYFGPCVETTRNWNEPHRCYGKRKFYNPSHPKGEVVTEPTTKNNLSTH